jgi:hypothetical protein
VPLRIQLDEVVRLPVAVARALIGRLVVNRLARLVGDVGDPVGQVRKLLGDARTAAEIGAVALGLVIRLHSLGDSTIALGLAGPTTSASSEKDDCSERK